MVKVFSRTDDNKTWREDPARSVADAMVERAKRLTTDWVADDIAEYSYADADDIVWKKWHAVLYKYDYLRDPETKLHMIVLEPLHEGKVWTTDYPFAFISSMRDAVHGTFAVESNTISGRRYFVRPGLPRKVRLFRVPLYEGHVTMGVRM